MTVTEGRSKFQVPTQQWIYAHCILKNQCLSSPRDTINLLMDSEFSSYDCYYIAICLEGFLFGAIPVLQSHRPLLKQSNPPRFQDSILVYSLSIYNAMHQEQAPLRRTMFYSMFSVSFIFYLSPPLVLRWYTML